MNPDNSPKYLKLHLASPNIKSHTYYFQAHKQVEEDSNKQKSNFITYLVFTKSVKHSITARKIQIERREEKERCGDVLQHTNERRSDDRKPTRGNPVCYC
ncbi:hypothetical protein QQ045_028804 [Rhodiola kirilowii]